MNIRHNRKLQSPEFVAKHVELHHYTTLDGLQGIIESNSLWATHFRFLNDSSEIYLLREPLRNAIESYLQPILSEKFQKDDRARVIIKNSGGIPAMIKKESKHFVDSLYKTTYESIKGLPLVNPYILSFCSHSSDSEYEQVNGLLSQWRGYAGSGGYCIVLDTEKLLDMLIKELDKYYWIHMSMSEVKYQLPDDVLANMFPSLIDHINKFFDGILSKRKPNIAGGFGPFLAGSASLKHRGFREEREVRVVASPAEESWIPLLKRETPNIPLTLPLKPILTRLQTAASVRYISLFSELGELLPIRRVIVGPSRHQQSNYDNAMRICKDQFEVVRSDTPYIG